MFCNPRLDIDGVQIQNYQDEKVIEFLIFSFIIRMKEYEREFRMNKRAERIALKKAKMEAMD